MDFFMFEHLKEMLMSNLIRALVVAEKPSVAASIAAALGANHRGDGYVEGGGFLVSWCLGHLVEQAEAGDYDPGYAKWTRGDLPIIPEQWKYRVIPETRKQYDTLTKLMNDERVTEIICATDAGREGELIFRLVYNLCGCRKPVKRLWVSSLEESAIRKGIGSSRHSPDS